MIIITNQSGIGRGLIKIKELENLHNYLRKKIKKDRAKIDDIFYCPFHPEFGKGKYKKKSLIKLKKKMMKSLFLKLHGLLQLHRSRTKKQK